MNYAGIAFVCIFFPGCAILAAFIEHIFDRRSGRATDYPNNPSAPGFANTYTFRFRNSKSDEITHSAASPVSLFRAINANPMPQAPKHVHILDSTRDDITITDAGGIHARCIIAGCQEAVYISPTFASLQIGQVMETRR